MAFGIHPARALLIIVVALLLSLVGLYLGEVFGIRWVREAGGILAAKP